MASRYVHYPSNASFETLSLVGSLSGGIVTFSANPSTASYPLVYPPAQGAAGEALVNDGNGNFSWLAAAGGITQLTGDGAAGPGVGAQTLTLVTVNSNVGSFGSATQVASHTVNAKGLITAASNVSIQIAESQVTNLISDLAGKQATGNYITALTGDATASGPGSVSLTLATVNAGVGSFGSATAVPSITVNGKGLVTAAASTSIQIAESQVTNLVSDLAGKQATGNYLTALTGDATASGPGSAALTLATVNSNVGSFGSATQVAGFTVNAKGLVTAAANTSIQIAESQVTNLVSDLAGKQATGNYITALTGDVTATGPGSVAASIASTTVTGKLLTGYVSGPGTVAATDSILQAIQKLNGNITAGSSIAAAASLSTGASLPSGANTKVPFNSVQVDTNSAFDTGNSRFVAPVATNYLVSGTISTQATTNTFTVWRVIIYKNGSEYRTIQSVKLTDVNSVNCSANTTYSLIIPLAVNDYVEVFAFQNSGSTETFMGDDTPIFGCSMNISAV